MNFIVVMLSFLFVDMFDTIGTLIGVSDKAGMLDEDGKLPNVKQALMADAIATSAGAILGTSTTTTFVESSAGVGAGARTGLDPSLQDYYSCLQFSSHQSLRQFRALQQHRR